MGKARRVGARGCRESSESPADEWINNEVMGCEFQDVRHGKRMRQLLEQFAGKVGATTPWACQDWANTKAAYRFFANERVTEADILAGHFASTQERAAGLKGPILVLHDTTEFSFQREKEIGLLHRTINGRNSWGQLKHRTICGLLMHSSLAVTT